MKPEDLIRELRSRLTAQADPEFRAGATRFFRESIDPYGVRTKDVQRLVPFLYKHVKPWAAADRNRFCEELWKSGKFEEGVLVAHLYRRFAGQCGAAEFRLFEHWIDRYVRNWAHADGVASWLLAASIKNEPGLIGRLPRWTRSRNRWKRRSAAVALMQEAKAGRHTAGILGIADLLAPDRDDMVEKGLGWLLKEAYPKQPAAIVEWLLGKGGAASRLVVRIAAEKMTPQDRAATAGRRRARTAIIVER